MRSYFSLSLLILAAGCQMSPIPRSIQQLHAQARQDVPVLEPVLKQGDILFRLSRTQLAGGLVDFSKEVADATESRFSHATLVYRVAPDGVVVVDMTPEGIARRYLVDWIVDGSNDVVVRRLKPEHAHLIPRVLAELDRLIAQDVLYDPKFIPDDDRYYCTELVDHCFRTAGRPLAERIRIKDLPRFSFIVQLCCLLGGIDTENEVAVVGNERFGLFSSGMMETVLELRQVPDPVPGTAQPVLVAHPPPRVAIEDPRAGRDAQP